MEKTSSSVNSEMLSLSKKVYDLSHKDVPGLLLIVNEKHRDSDRILEEIQRNKSELAAALDQTTKYLRSAKDKDADLFLESAVIFSGQSAPFMRSETGLYTIYKPQADTMFDYLNNGGFIKKFDGETPIGLGRVLPERESIVSVVADLFKSKETRIKESLDSAIDFLPVSIEKRGWPCAVSAKNLIEVGPMVAQLALENQTYLIDMVKKYRPDPVSERKMRDIIKDAKPILLESRLSSLASFTVRVYGQLAKSSETDIVRRKIVSEAVGFRDKIVESYGKVKVTPDLLRGFFYYKALQVKYGQLPEVWSNEIKSFDWKDVIPDNMKRHILKENNMWILK